MKLKSNIASNRIMTSNFNSSFHINKYNNLSTYNIFFYNDIECITVLVHTQINRPPIIFLQVLP